ncbi:MAG: hypothetical protein A2289_06700 [Deltaproteobacteria bacterium RIFOXYA12_FULL_58_15]|nr:MAG: hypothetical protein A2289_06700 [Deltaproteobacteria bacterium RIFOXYA12_FULL_58_15]OGR09366.1 MAG: hypothetical protein A2341_02020 [Deltaproteobacteria bacterium RIFOXYB12_FULL_58_9]
MTSELDTILVVDDEEVVHTVVGEVIAEPGRRVLHVSTAKDAIKAIASHEDIDLALIDKNLPDGSGVDVARVLRDRHPNTPVILMTGYASLNSAIEALRIGAYDYVTKPFEDINRLALEVRNALDAGHLKKQQQRLLDDLKDSERRYSLAAAGVNDGLWEWTVATGGSYFSERWSHMLGCEQSNLDGNIDDWLKRIHEDDAERVRVALQHHVEGRSSHFEDEHRILHSDGTYRWVVARGMAERDATGKGVRVAGSLSDVTVQRLAEQQMRHDAFHDAVTFLPNRVLLMDRLSLALARTRRGSGHQFAVLLLDLDRFKVVNDSLGHAAGDLLLTATARRLEKCLRAGDTAARLGGDEFAIILDDIAAVADAVTVAERVQLELSAPLRLHHQDVYTTTSIGIALSRPEHTRPEEILRDADVAMYRAKALGKARYVVFDPTMQTGAVKQLELDSALRQAIERREFVLYYQPIVALGSGQIAGFEALIRWQHPERGLVPPMEFIPTAEDTGLIVPISNLVLAEAVNQLRELLERFPQDPPLFISVNVSSKHLGLPGLIGTIGQILLETRVPASSLKLEITESAVLEDSAMVSLNLDKLKGLGIELSMDDFGTGYSSLSYLHRLPIDTLKIDRSFISNLGVDGENPVIVHTIITLARVLGMEVVAEGIETEAQLMQLRALGCHQGQGYFFSKPRPANEIVEMLERRPRW